MLSVARCALGDLKTSKEVKDKLHIYNVNEVFVDCSRRWTQQLLTMNGISAPKCM
jgi:hypothetical protein